MDSTLAITERNDSLAIIRLNPPEKHAALSREMIVTLQQIFQDLENQPDLRAIILTGAGDGAVPKTELAVEPAAVTPLEVCEDYQEHQALYDQIEKCTVPVIGTIDGLATGVGFELVLACHLRIASSNASFSLLPQATLDSIAAHSAGQRLAREIGNAHALEISRSGKTVFAEEALRIGLINRVVPEHRLVIEAESLARQISTMAPLAIRACLEAVTHGIELPLSEGLALEAQLFSSLFATDDVREGTSAFLEKRQPVFKGM